MRTLAQKYIHILQEGEGGSGSQWPPEAKEM